jgi:hypothetical protein
VSRGKSQLNKPGALRCVDGETVLPSRRITRGAQSRSTRLISRGALPWTFRKQRPKCEGSLKPT